MQALSRHGYILRRIKGRQQLHNDRLVVLARSTERRGLTDDPAVIQLDAAPLAGGSGRDRKFDPAKTQPVRQGGGGVVFAIDRFKSSLALPGRVPSQSATGKGTAAIVRRDGKRSRSPDTAIALGVCRPTRSRANDG